MKKQAGFTLIELAIVLVIIGLLLGGVLKGQELINSAKVKNMASDFRNTQVYIYGYQDKYRALPGDDAHADTHLTGGTLGAGGTLGNGVIEGVWDATTSPPTTESSLFWQHVRLAGLAPGPTSTSDANYLPHNADGGIIGVQSVAATGGFPPGFTGAFAICSAGILGKFAKQLDTTLDDGTTNTGSVRVYATVVGGWLANASVVDSTTYNVCMTF